MAKWSNSKFNKPEPDKKDIAANVDVDSTPAPTSTAPEFKVPEFNPFAHLPSSPVPQSESVDLMFHDRGEGLTAPAEFGMDPLDPNTPELLRPPGQSESHGFNDPIRMESGGGLQVDSVPVTLGQEMTLNDNFYLSVVQGGHRSDLIDALVSHPDNNTSDKWLRLAAALADPVNVGIKFSTLCRKVKIPWKELVPYFLDFQRAQAMYNVALAIPTVAEHTVKDAQNTERKCPNCKGSGQYQKFNKKTGEKVGEPEECAMCEGSGKVEIKGNKDDRKLSLEMAGMIKNAPLVNVNQNFGVGIEDTMRDVTDILAEPGKD